VRSTQSEQPITAVRLQRLMRDFCHVRPDLQIPPSLLSDSLSIRSLPHSRHLAMSQQLPWQSSGLALTESTATQQYRHERTMDDDDDEEEYEERDTQRIFDARHREKAHVEEVDEENEAADHDDADDEEDSFDATSISNAAFIASHHSASVGSSLDWCATFLERDDLVGLDGGEDEELVDLRREYGAPLSTAFEKHLPSLTARLEAELKPAAEKQLSLLREDGEAEAEDDWDMLGLQCDCACASCRATFVAPDFDQFQAQQSESSQDGGAEESDECECLEFDQPASLHIVLLDLFEDFFRFRVHLHRVTFATALDRARRAAKSKGLSMEDEEKTLRATYIRSLALLKARARRDLKHMELLEACANQLGWNLPDSPAFSPSAVFCEMCPPGPALLSGLLIEFLSYFLVHKTTCSNFDKTKMSSMCSNLALFAIKTGDLESASHTGHRCCNEMRG
jgi:hypothetical protein